MRNLVRATLLAASFSAVVTSSAAAQTQITSRAQITVPTTLLWSALGTNGSAFGTAVSTTHGGISVNAATDGSFLRLDAGNGWAGGYTTGDALLFAGDGTFIDLTFGGLVNAFATQGWYNFSGSGTVQLQAFRAGSLLGSFDIAMSGGSAPNDNQAPVIGFADAAGFDRLVLTAGREFSINQATFGGITTTTTTPEPATFALVAGGLAMVGVAARRRRVAR